MKVSPFFVVVVALGLACSRGAEPAQDSEKSEAPSARLGTVAEKTPFTLLATGDNQGEIAPCG